MFVITENITNRPVFWRNSNNHDILRTGAVGCSDIPLTAWQTIQYTTQSLSPWTFKSPVTCLVTAATKQNKDLTLCYGCTITAESQMVSLAWHGKAENFK